MNGAAAGGPMVVSFGPYRLDRLSGRLLRGDANVPLRLKAFAVLEYLALHPGRLVPKDELLDAVWPATHVSPSVLSGCIRELRSALGDDARCARFIETAHRRGYRFIAPPATSPIPATPPVSRTARELLMPRGDTELARLARQFARAVARIARRRRTRRMPGGPGPPRDRGPTR